MAEWLRNDGGERLSFGGRLLAVDIRRQHSMAEVALRRRRPVVFANVEHVACAGLHCSVAVLETEA